MSLLIYTTKLPRVPLGEAYDWSEMPQAQSSSCGWTGAQLILREF